MENPRPKDKHEKFTPFIYTIKQKQKLNKEFEKREEDFLKVFFARRSYNEFSEISIAEVEELLFYSCHIMSGSMDEFGFFLTKRVAPSAGARHPIDLLISLPGTISKRALSYYNPVEHTLSELSIKKNKALNFFKEVNQNLSIENACIIWFSIQSRKTSSKYHNPESLYWRDAGVLLYCIQLVACYLNLKSCPLGSLAADTFYELFDTTELLSGGGILIGK